jgi:uncharacterized protein YjiS (DUF1127 family)
MTTSSSAPSYGSLRGLCPATSFQTGIGELQAAFALWRDRTSRRRAAVAIDDRTLADIGLTRAHVDYEAAKPFWKA